MQMSKYVQILTTCIRTMYLNISTYTYAVAGCYHQQQQQKAKKIITTTTITTTSNTTTMNDYYYFHHQHHHRHLLLTYLLTCSILLFYQNSHYTHTCELYRNNIVPHYITKHSNKIFL